MDHISKLSIRQRSILQRHELCGCYYCLKVYPSNEIKNWTDDGETALCVKCGIDTVLAGFTNKDHLKEIRDYFFGPRD